MLATMHAFLLATLDTKGEEIRFVRDRMIALGISTRVVNTGCLDEPTIQADITREKVFEAAG